MKVGKQLQVMQISLHSISFSKIYHRWFGVVIICRDLVKTGTTVQVHGRRHMVERIQPDGMNTLSCLPVKAPCSIIAFLFLPGMLAAGTFFQLSHTIPDLPHSNRPPPSSLHAGIIWFHLTAGYIWSSMVSSSSNPRKQRSIPNQSAYWRNRPAAAWYCSSDQPIHTQSWLSVLLARYTWQICTWPGSLDRQFLPEYKHGDGRGKYGLSVNIWTCYRCADPLDVPYTCDQVGQGMFPGWQWGRGCTNPSMCRSPGCLATNSVSSTCRKHQLAGRYFSNAPPGWPWPGDGRSWGGLAKMNQKVQDVQALGSPWYRRVGHLALLRCCPVMKQVIDAPTDPQRTEPMTLFARQLSRGNRAAIVREWRARARVVRRQREDACMEKVSESPFDKQQLVWWQCPVSAQRETRQVPLRMKVFDGVEQKDRP